MNAKSDKISPTDCTLTHFGNNPAHLISAVDRINKERYTLDNMAKRLDVLPYLGRGLGI